MLRLQRIVPGGFVPAQDKQYLIGFAQLPDGASLDRTEDVIRRMSEIIALKTAGRRARGRSSRACRSTASPTASNAGIVFVTLKDFDEAQDGKALSGRCNRGVPSTSSTARSRDAFIVPCSRRRRCWVSARLGGFKLQLEDRGALGYAALERRHVKAVHGKGKRSRLNSAGTFSSYQVNVPQLYADIDRVKAKQLGVPVDGRFQHDADLSRQSLYVNDFNKFGRTYQVRVQADAPFRAHAEDMGLLKVRNATSGEMVPLSALMKVTPTLRSRARACATTAIPRRRHQRWPPRPALFVRSGAGRDGTHRWPRRCRRASSYEWTDLTYQEILAGNAFACWVFPLSACCSFSWCSLRSTRA